MNQLVHLIFVPAILVTSFVFANYADFSGWIPLSGVITPYVGALGLDLFAALFYMAAYIYYCPNAVGVSAAGLVLLGLWSAQAFVQEYGAGAWIPALGLHILSWILQVHVGHTVSTPSSPS
jgi:uncharacterized membrane protein YGL010W